VDAGGTTGGHVAWWAWLVGWVVLAAFVGVLIGQAVRMAEPPDTGRDRLRAAGDDRIIPTRSHRSDMLRSIPSQQHR
jgi:hypothetical protein